MQRFRAMHKAFFLSISLYFSGYIPRSPYFPGWDIVSGWFLLVSAQSQRRFHHIVQEHRGIRGIGEADGDPILPRLHGPEHLLGGTVPLQTAFVPIRQVQQNIPRL